MMMNHDFPTDTLNTRAIDAKFWAAHAGWRSAVDAFEADDSPEGSPRRAQLERAHLEASHPMLAATTATAAALWAKLQAIKKGGSTMLDTLVHPSYTALDVIIWDVERLALQGLASVPWQVGRDDDVRKSPAGDGN